MNQRGKLLWLPLMLLLMLAISIPSLYALTRGEDGEEEGPILVGHISYVEGNLFRYDPEEKDWVATVKDAPFGENDIAYSDKHGKAELLMPNNTWVRIGGDTQIELTALNDEVTEIDVSSGVTRFYNKSSQAVVKATTFYGSVLAPAETSFDVYVGDHSVEVIALKGTVDFFHRTTDTKYEVISGSSSFSADSRQVRAEEGLGDYSWNNWNRERDSLWARREQERRDSAKYLPPSLYDEAYALDEAGSWENIYYDGAYRVFWRPIYVPIGWSPFTVGRWARWCGHPTWIPYEPFGYITHHYGSWLFAGRFWYWAPPVTWFNVHVGYSPLRIGFGWYPGRVAWIHHRDHIGWVPLAPFEPYYCYRRWGPHTVVVNKINITNITIHRNRYRYFNHAVIINRNHLYSVNNYQKVRVGNVPPSLRDHFRVAPGLETPKVKVDTASKERYNFSTTGIARKQAHFATDTLHQNRPGASESIKVSTRKIQHKSTEIGQNRFREKSRGETLSGNNRKVLANQATTAVSERKFGKSDLKGRNWSTHSFTRGQHLQASQEQGKTWQDKQLRRRQSSGSKETRSTYKRESLTMTKQKRVIPKIQETQPNYGRQSFYQGRSFSSRGLSGSSSLQTSRLRSLNGMSGSQFGSGGNNLSHSGKYSSRSNYGYSGMYSSKGHR